LAFGFGAGVIGTTCCREPSMQAGMIFSGFWAILVARLIWGRPGRSNWSLLTAPVALLWPAFHISMWVDSLARHS
jgi:hypothetical protein